MNDDELKSLASEVFAIGLADGGRPWKEYWKPPTGRELMMIIAPKAKLADEYRRQLRAVYGAGLSLGMWRQHHRERA